MSLTNQWTPRIQKIRTARLRHRSWCFRSSQGSVGRVSLGLDSGSVLEEFVSVSVVSVSVSLESVSVSGEPVSVPRVGLRLLRVDLLVLFLILVLILLVPSSSSSSSSSSFHPPPHPPHPSLPHHPPDSSSGSGRPPGGLGLTLTFREDWVLVADHWVADRGRAPFIRSVSSSSSSLSLPRPPHCPLPCPHVLSSFLIVLFRPHRTHSSPLLVLILVLLIVLFLEARMADECCYRHVGNAEIVSSAANGSIDSMIFISFGPASTSLVSMTSSPSSRAASTT